jgi:uncharacterized protein YfaP (DUF2135 family)
MNSPLITCWNCDTIYNHSTHSICPICDHAWYDNPIYNNTIEPGERVSVVIDYETETLHPVI